MQTKKAEKAILDARVCVMIRRLQETPKDARVRTEAQALWLQTSGVQSDRLYAALQAAYRI